MPKPDAKALLACAKSYEPAMQSFLQDLVRIPSVNGRETEKSVANRILEDGLRLGFSSNLAFKDESRPNVLVELGKGKNGFALIGHMDTVAEGKTEDWTYPPFSAAIFVRPRKSSPAW
jgi:acetylornithine deacetylase/succinyl-diaminopimelate desuccinylase-like protein